jgi:hypothetical protein
MPPEETQQNANIRITVKADGTLDRDTKAGSTLDRDTKAGSTLTEEEAEGNINSIRLVLGTAHI